MSTEVKLMSADELLVLPENGFRYELVEGELKKMSLGEHDHGRVIIQLSVPLASHVREHRWGVVFAAGTGFKLTSTPDTVLAPDIAFVAQQRVDDVGDTPGYWLGPPDLAVEITSPTDTVYEVEGKVGEWLEVGTRAVWVVSPKLRNVTVYRSLTDISILTEKGTLDGGDVVPGFQIPVAEIFAD